MNDYDQTIERMYHPENFEKDYEQEDNQEQE